MIIIGFVYGDGNCPLSATVSEPGPQDLQFCTQYANNSCCSPTQDYNVSIHFNQSVLPLFKDGGCAANIKRLLCGFTCDPNQFNFTIFSNLSGNPLAKNMTIYVNTEFATAFYQACKGVCLPFAGGIIVGGFYGTYTSFLALFDSASDQTYVPSPTLPRIFYLSGENPNTNQSFNFPTVNASAIDVAGCNLPPPSPNTSSILKAIIALAIVILAFV